MPPQLPTESIDLDYARRYSSVPSGEGEQGEDFEELGKGRSPTQRPRWIHVLMGAVGVISVAIVLLLIAGTRQVVLSVSALEGAICDPYAVPGYLKYSDDLTKTKWLPFDRNCTTTDWLTQLSAGSLPETFPRNTTILVMGDSVDRNSVEQLAWRTGVQYHRAAYHDITQERPEGWDERGVPFVVKVPSSNLTFANGFFYGLDDTDDFSTSNDWHKPGLAEDRIELFRTFTDQLETPVSFISLHSGLWDLALFGRQDKAANRSTEIPLSEEQMDWWMRRMTHVIRTVRRVYPGTPLWFRKLHRIGHHGTDSTGDYRKWGHEGEDGQRAFDFFTDERTQQIRAMSDRVCELEGVPVFDFGAVWEGQQAYQDKVHPLPNPGGYAIMEPLLHHVWMESQRAS